MCIIDLTKLSDTQSDRIVSEKQFSTCLFAYSCPVISISQVKLNKKFVPI